jgi:hypothetical protein
MKKLCLIFVIFLVLISFVSASQFYNETGGENNDFNGGTTLFNDDYFDVYGIPAPYPALISNSNNATPLVGDFDADGISDIVLMSGNSLKLYHGKTLMPNDSITIGANNQYSPLYSYDIDGDGKTEIFVADIQKRNFSVIKYNGTFSIFNKYELLDKGASTTTDELQVMFKCIDTDLCFIAYTDRSDLGTYTAYLYGATFNRSEFTGWQKIDQYNNAPFCFPRIPYISASDYDIDGDTDLFFSANQIERTTPTETAIYKMSLNSSNQFSGSLFKSMYGAGYGIGCNWATGFLTSPLVFDAETGGKQEIIIGHSYGNVNEFRISVFDYLGNEINQHPSISEADGQIVSNVIRMSAFPDGANENKDYCVMGYMPTGQILDLICGSSDNSYQGLDTIQFFTNYRYYNLTTGNSFMPMTFKINAKLNNFEGENTDEVINTFGIYELTSQNCDLPGCGLCTTLINQCKLENIFPNGAFGTVIPVDFENEGFTDYLAVTSDQLIYVDDKRSNSAPKICPETGDCYINPSNPIQINSTIGVYMDSSDADDDLVNYRVTFYYGDSNEYSLNWTANVSTGQTIALTTTANKTISSGTIRLQVRDNYNPLVNTDYLDYSFSVSNDGYVFGESQTNIGGTAEEEDLTLSDINPETISSDNPLTTTVNDFANNFGFSGTLTYLILMLLMGIGVFIAGIWTKFPANMTTAFLISIEVLMLIIGVYLEYIGVGIIIVLVLIAIGFILPFVKNIFVGSSAK